MIRLEKVVLAPLQKRSVRPANYVSGGPRSGCDDRPDPVDREGNGGRLVDDEATQLRRQGDDHPAVAYPAVHLGDRAVDLANPPGIATRSPSLRVRAIPILLPSAVESGRSPARSKQSDHTRSHATREKAQPRSMLLADGLRRR